MQQPPQPTIPPCPQCSGQRVGMGCPNDMQLTRQSRGLSYTVSGLKALVCIRCGYTMLYAEDLPKIQEGLRKHPGDFSY